MTESPTGEISSKEEILKPSANIEDKWFPTQGRIRRLSYLIKMTFMMTLMDGGLSLLFTFERLIFSVWSFGDIFRLVLYLVFSTIVLVTMFYTAQRLRDTGNKPWLAVFILIPVLNIILFLYVILAPSVADGTPPPLDSRLIKITALVLIPIVPFSAAFFIMSLAITMPVSIFIAFIFLVLISDAENIRDSHRAPPPASQAVIVAILITLLPFLIWLAILFMNQVRDWW